MRQMSCIPCAVCRFKQTYEGLPEPAVQDEVARFLYLHHHGGASHCACTPTYILTYHLQDHCATRQAILSFLPDPPPADSTETRQDGRVRAQVFAGLGCWCGMRRSDDSGCAVVQLCS